MDEIDFERAAIVAAHPDDEVLWFGSLVPRVGRIVLCYGMQASGTGGTQRRRVVDEYPYRSIEFFDLIEPGSYTKALWPPVFGPMGLELDAPSPAHESSFSEIVARLRQTLSGVTTVFTHNPWGEYGNEEHTLVYAAVNSLKREFGFELYVSSYVGVAMLDLFRQVVDEGINDIRRYRIDKLVAAMIVQLYRKHGAWTWFQDWTWPDEESFVRMGPEGRIRNRCLSFKIMDVPRY